MCTPTQGVWQPAGCVPLAPRLFFSFFSTTPSLFLSIFPTTFCDSAPQYFHTVVRPSNATRGLWRSAALARAWELQRKEQALHLGDGEATPRLVLTASARLQRTSDETIHAMKGLPKSCSRAGGDPVLLPYPSFGLCVFSFFLSFAQCACDSASTRQFAPVSSLSAVRVVLFKFFCTRSKPCTAKSSERSLCVVVWQPEGTLKKVCCPKTCQLGGAH